MELIDTRVYTGRNIYSHKACARFIVDIKGFEEIPTKNIKDFNQNLLRLMPGLKEHKCSVGYTGGFCERLEEGTYLPHVFEHMLIEMQNRLGFTNVKYGKARQLKDSLYYVVIQYELEEAVLGTCDIGIKMINAIISGKNYEISIALEDLERRLALKKLGPSTRSICEEATKRNIPVMKIGNDSLFQLGYGKYQKRIEATLTNKTSCLGVDISCDKELTKEILKYNNLPVTDGYVGDNIISVIKLCKKIGYPLVIKPVNGSKGKGVTVNINTENEAVAAYHEAARINNRVVVEKYIQGEDYRILVVNGRVVAAARRLPPMVKGDGVHTLKELIDLENCNPLRGYDHEKPLTKILIDDIMIHYLKKKNLSLSYVPAKEEAVILRFNANLSTGGEAIDCTDQLHHENVEIAIKAANVIGLDIAGIDICSSDIKKSINETGGVILEVNAAPGIRMHLNPTYGKERNVAADILDYLFENSQTSIPVVAITGTNGKTTVTRMIGHIMECSGLTIGMTTTGGIFINGEKVLKGDTTGPDSARMVLMNNSIDAAVLETARGGILRGGLGYDRADIGVITNISEDHLGLEGINTIEELTNVKSLVAEAVKENGYVVLNADDVNTKTIINRIHTKYIYFTKNAEKELIKQHLEEDGVAICLENGFIVLCEGSIKQNIVKAIDMPSTLQGALAYNIENAMAAAAACYGIGIDLNSIAMGLKTFICDEHNNPGRFNLYRVNNINLIVDYGHNIEAYKAVMNGLQKLNTKRVVGIIGVPGDRTDESIMKLGFISGEGFDYIYIKEDMDKRGRKNGDVIKLLEKGILLSKMGEKNYEIIENEGAALKQALNNAYEGDTIIVFYENYQLIMDTINEFANRSTAISEVEKVV